MANYSEHDLEDARSVIGSLLSRNQRRDGIQIPEKVILSDIEQESEDFLYNLEFLRRIDAPALALRVGRETLIPASLSSVFGEQPRKMFGRSPRLVFTEFYYEFREDIQELRRSGKLGRFEAIPEERALSSFHNLASKFLATRMAAVRDWGGSIASRTLQMFPRLGSSHRIATPGCNFTVSTASKGLRVFWSGAYYLSSNYFGSPTTPISSTLQAGTYVFGVDGGAYPGIQWDEDAVVSLPGTPSVHLNF